MEIKKADNPNWKRHERAQNLFWVKILGAVLLAGLILSSGFVFLSSLPTN